MLITYKITKQSLINIQQEFTRVGQDNLGNNLVNGLTQLLDKNFESRNDFIAAIESIVGKEIIDKFQLSFLKHCVNNFSNQLVLLNGFVYEETDMPKSEILKFEKIIT